MDLIAKASNPFDEMNRKLNPKDKEHSLKSFYKEFKKVIEAADVLIEVLDARDPVGSRCPQVEEMIINSGKNKKLVLLLNKIGKSQINKHILNHGKIINSKKISILKI